MELFKPVLCCVSWVLMSVQKWAVMSRVNPVLLISQPKTNQHPTMHLPPKPMTFSSSSKL